MVYKGYTKQATSQKMMRIIKREYILSIIIAGIQSGHVTLERTEPTPEGMRRSDMDWHEANRTTMTIKHATFDKELFDYKLYLIRSTEWLDKSLVSVEEKDGFHIATFTDTNKLRLYYNWLHKKKEFTIQNVLKYMYSPLFLAMHFLDQVVPINGDLSLVFDLPKSDLDELKKWMLEVLQYETVFTADNHCAFVDTEKVRQDVIKAAMQYYMQTTTEE